jgi:CheY-like chemotaxis protein
MPIDLLAKSQARTDKRLVYVVDDEAVIALTLTAIINNKGFDARSFTGPRDALAAARLLAPDVLLTDAIMDEMNGVDLAIEVSRLCPECKVLLLSGLATTTELQQRARDAGHNFEVLTKPLHPLTIIERLQQLLPPAPPPAQA